MLESLPDPDTSSEDLASSRFTWVKVHQAALGALYHVPISSAMVRKLGRHFIISLANTADFYACSDAVSTQIHNITMAEPQRQRILTSCKKEPLAMLRFGMTIKAEMECKGGVNLPYLLLFQRLAPFREDGHRRPGQRSSLHT